MIAKLFPILKDKLKIEPNWEYKNETKNQIEQWKITKIQYDDDLWELTYDFTLK